MKRCSIALTACLLAAACAEEPAAPPPADLPTLTHDFGVIRHGRSASHTFVVPVPDDGEAWIPVGFAQSCSCATHRFEILAPDGSRRFPTGQPFATFAVGEGEQLTLHVTVDTSLKEPASRPSVPIDGSIVLQTAGTPFRRAHLPVSFRFGIEAPIEILPAATVDLGRVPRMQRYARSYVLRPTKDVPTYGEVRCLERDPEDPNRFRDTRDIAVELRTDGDDTTLRVSVRPAPDRPTGPFTAYATIATDLDGGYVLRLPISGIVVPLVELAPPGRIAFGQIDLAAPASAHVVVLDHDTSRDPEFRVLRIVDDAGNDVSSHFSARFEPVPEQPRGRALVLEYHGTLAGPRFLRGEVELARPDDEAVVRAIEYSAYQRR